MAYFRGLTSTSSQPSTTLAVAVSPTVVTIPTSTVSVSVEESKPQPILQPQPEPQPEPQPTSAGEQVNNLLEEKTRYDRFIKFERENTIGILIDEKLTKFDCFDILHKAGIQRPKIYDLGFPNANCIGCVKSQSPTYWNLVRQKFPEVFSQRAEQSRRIGAKLVKYKGERIFLDELPLNAKGGKIKSWECGIFCDTE